MSFRKLLCLVIKGLKLIPTISLLSKNSEFIFVLHNLPCKNIPHAFIR